MVQVKKAKLYFVVISTAYFLISRSLAKMERSEEEISLNGAAASPMHCSNCRSRLFFIIVSGVRMSPLGSAATTGLLYQPQIIMMIMEKLVE
jgi:hypothetical protein